ncbi:uncharacterized protein F5891DRAFT_984570 [Suillus fuscotomentosus]|uniref:Uncharacterized protein n=1 Tax=Suillus fuscotomentosus TaxID=1912939 RepID=A0AAD4DVS1_9AGAM|nr:uncharacterized protein F5891DRAFT_984570 [Suillus fuscotomentosus]KAG1894985.1 hypothetical protein F5891DRAFT_984570 [Suillus fuscotomentosus]
MAVTRKEPQNNEFLTPPPMLTGRLPPRREHPEQSKVSSIIPAKVTMHDQSPTVGLVNLAPQDLATNKPRPRPWPAGKMSVPGKRVLLNHFVDNTGGSTVRTGEGQVGPTDDKPLILQRTGMGSEEISEAMFTTAKCEDQRLTDNTCEEPHAAVSRNGHAEEYRPGGNCKDGMKGRQKDAGGKWWAVDQLPEPPKKRAVRVRKLPARYADYE